MRSLRSRSKSSSQDAAPPPHTLETGTNADIPYDGATLSTASSYSSFSELESSTTAQRRIDGTLSRSNSVSAKLKGLFHKSPQNSSLHLPINHSKSALSPERPASPKSDTRELEITAHPSHQHPAAPSTSPAQKVTVTPATPSPPPPAVTRATSTLQAPVSTNGRPDPKKSLSNSDISGSMARLKLQMPPVIENDLDEVLEGAEGKPQPMSRESSSAKDPLVKQTSRGRIRGMVKSSASGSDSSIASRSRSASRQRDSSVLQSPTLPPQIVEKLRSLKHHRDGNLILFDNDSAHVHDFSKLKKDPIQTSPSGILSSLLGVKKKEVNPQDHLHDVKLEASYSLLPDNYSEELIMFKLKPENYRYNYEDYLYGNDSSGSDSSFESDSDYDSDEDIDPIIGEPQLNIINSLVEKIEHLEKHKEKIASAKKLKLIDKYGKIQGVVGRGSYGVVKLAVKQLPNKTQRIFAIKELKQKSNENVHHFSNRLTSEFMISSSLTHQSIINTYDIMVDLTSLTYLQVMDYVPCGDLFSLVQSSNGDGLHPTEADCFFKQTLNAVSYLHSVGISHNDLKVENLLLTLTGQLKIIDFGTSTPIKCAWEDHCSRLSGAQGSEPYCGPEMFVDKDYDSRLLDIWALGVIYLVMVSGGYSWKIADAKADSAYNYFLESRPSDEGGKGSYDSIESLTGKNKNSKKKVLYGMLHPDPHKRIRLKEIWKSKWVSNIELCEAGQGLVPVNY